MLTLSRWKIVSVVLAAIFGLVFTLPNLLPAQTRDQLPAFLPKKTLNLGLDLQGGSQLLLEVDTNALRAEKLTNLVEDVRTSLREEKIEFSDLKQASGAVSVRITNPSEVSKAAGALRRTVGAPLVGAPGGRDATVSTLPDQSIRIAFVEEAMNAQAAKAVEQSIEIVRRRVDELGTKEPNIYPQGTNRIVVQAPGESDPERLKNIIGKTAKLTFQMVDETADPAQAGEGRTPPGSELLPSDDQYQAAYVVKRRALVTGEMLLDSRQANDPQTGQPVVTFRFNGQGARRFADATGQENVGKRFAIVLDGRVISAPRINEPITGGSGQITGNFTYETANDLAVLLRAGALPTTLTVEEQRTVSAELGADAIRAGAISLAIGAVAIVVFIVLAYGMFGVFASVALVVNVLLIVGIMSFTQATLTFPGIAGLILTLAVAVDANVLIYERVRDEAHAGRTPISALEHGYQRALVSIFLDANITSAISAIIMFQFGSGPVRGFAWMLLVGVITSVFTAVVITQLLITWWLRVRKPKVLPIV